MSNSLHKFLNKNRHVNYIDRYILNEFVQIRKCKKFLRENDDIFVTKADKDQVIIIMDKNNYVMNMNKLLNDQLTYKHLKKDSIKSMTSKLNQLVKS